MSFNLKNTWGEPDVANLFASVADDRNWQIIVDKGGNVSLLDTTGARPSPISLHMYFETYIQGNGYVGALAAADTRHVHDVAESLRENWPVLKYDAYIDH